MFSYRYDIKSFNDVVPSFLDFCAFFDYNQDNIIVNYGYDNWHGATVAIPISDYKVEAEFTDSIYLLGDPTFYSLFFICYKNYSRYANKWYLGNTLKRIYPNSNILVENQLSTSEYLTMLSGLSDSKVVYVFGNNITNRYGSISGLFDYLDTMNDVCLSNNLDLYLVYAPTEEHSDELYDAIESYAYQAKPRKILNFYSELADTRLDMQVALDYNTYQLTDYRSIYGVQTYVGIPTYSRNIAALFTRFILSNVFHKDREEYYVSLMYSNNPKTWYSQLFTTYDEYMIEEFNYDQYIHGGWSIQSKYGSNPPNIFKNTGELVSVGVHTSYDPFLWMCEQGGITCKKEEDEQIEDLDLMGFYAFLNGSPNKKVKPPVFPTTGCPWFTISSKNIADYGIANCPAKLYITRVGSSFILTIRVIDANGQKPDLWQSITFGEFVGRIDGYNIDQFYCAGGNQALSPDSWTYFATSHIIGLQMDLDMKNSSIVNSNILHPSKFEKTNLSNFRIMNGEGTWEDIYSATQGYKEYQYLDGNGNATIYTWGVPLTKPNFNISNNLNTAYPYLDWQHKIDSYTINKYDLKKNDMSGKIDPLTVYLAK